MRNFVIGIVAGRIKEKFHRPVAVVALEGSTGKASARSVSGFDFGAAVIAARDTGMLEKGGGHAMAAGFTVAETQLPALHAFLNKRLLLRASGPRTLHADGCIALSGLTPELALMLERAAPFGQGNAAPRLVVQHAMLSHVEAVGADQSHLRVILTDDKIRFAAMAFRAANTALGKALLQARGSRVHALGQLRYKTWQGREQAEFTIEDVAAA